MLFSLFSTRLVPRLLVGTPLLRNVAIPLATRRVVASPFSTSRLVLQAAAAKPATTKASSPVKKSAAKPTRKPKATASTTKATVKKPARKAASKSRTTTKARVGARATKKKVAVKKTPYKLTKEDKPPSPPLNPYTLFCAKFLRGAYETTDASERTMEHARSLIKSAAATWRALSEHEKQAFRDEFVVLRDEHQKKRQAYNSTVSVAALRALNMKRKKSGKTKIRVPSTNPKPVTAFLQYALEYRKQEGRDTASRAAVVEAGRLWREMSEAEKEPYYGLYRTALEEWKAKNQ